MGWSTALFGQGIFDVGTASERQLGDMAVCWKHFSACTECAAAFLGVLHLQEHLCTLSTDTGEVHNCASALKSQLCFCVLFLLVHSLRFCLEMKKSGSGVPFGGTCEVACEEGFQGQKQTMTCEANGIFSGNQPDCREVPCTSVSLHAVKVGAGCQCGDGFYGDIQWNQQQFTGACARCNEQDCSEGRYLAGCGGTNRGTCEPCTGLGQGQYFTSNGGAKVRLAKKNVNN